MERERKREREGEREYREKDRDGGKEKHRGQTRILDNEDRLEEKPNMLQF